MIKLLKELQPSLIKAFFTACFIDAFFSSRRRQTRLTCDWSSDVCSSDLKRSPEQDEAGSEPAMQRILGPVHSDTCPVAPPGQGGLSTLCHMPLSPLDAPLDAGWHPPAQNWPNRHAAISQPARAEFDEPHGHFLRSGTL